MKRKLKVGIWVLSDYKPHIGGGFSLYEKIIQLADAYTFSDDIEVCFVGHQHVSKFNFKKEYICIDRFPLSIVPFIGSLALKYSHKIKFITGRECDFLKKNNVDLIYYPVQGFKKVTNFPFVTANWDIGHKSMPAFPEVAMNGAYEYREKWYSKEINKALMVFAESEAGREEMIFYTRCNPGRVAVVPLFPGGVIDVVASSDVQEQKLKDYDLRSQGFYFYPAQFWAHKNHYNLLLAFKELAAMQADVKLVLAGSDKGNKAYIEQAVKDLRLSGKVLITGFVDNESMLTFYRHALALVMPSFLGPTNMPLLEARVLGCPVLCSDLKGHREMMDNGALYFNPHDHHSLAQAMKEISEDDTRTELLKKAGHSLQKTQFTSAKAMQALNDNFLALRSVRHCWGSNDQIF